MHIFYLFLSVGFGFSCLLFGVALLVRLKTIEAAQRRLEPHEMRLRDPTDVAAQKAARRPLRVVILHPDLGIGGAERLIIDAAVGLQKHQQVTPLSTTIVTNHHDPRRAFPETVDGTVTVHVCGAWLPASFFGRAKVFCATLRMMWAAFVAASSYPDTDCFMVDQVAAVLPVLCCFAPQVPRLFYCHFPDQCCDSNRDIDGCFVKPPSKLHIWYRRFFDAVEARAMGYADSIVSNSKFSRDMAVKTFPQLRSVIDPEMDIFYPPVSWPAESAPESGTEETEVLLKRIKGHTVVLSINRYERKKNLALAIESFARVVSKTLDVLAKPPLLIIAGGYDLRLAENVEHLQELKELAASYHHIAERVIFLQNISNATKSQLLSHCCCLVYTPTMEHFGIVPTEAMVCARPVVAVNQGGPCESVGEGGSLCEPTPEAFAEAIAAYMTDENLAKRVGTAGRQRALRLFSIDVFSEKLATRLVALWTKKNATFALPSGGRAMKED